MNTHDVDSIWHINKLNYMIIFWRIILTQYRVHGKWECNYQTFIHTSRRQSASRTAFTIQTLMKRKYWFKSYTPLQVIDWNISFKLSQWCVYIRLEYGFDPALKSLFWEQFQTFFFYQWLYLKKVSDIQILFVFFL